MLYDTANLRALLSGCFPIINADHDNSGHYYVREDTKKRAASVTTKLGFVSKGYLQAWFVKLAVEYIQANIERVKSGDWSVFDEAKLAGDRSRDNSAVIGTTAHDAIDRFCTQWIKEDKKPEGSAAQFLAEGSRGEEIAACRSFDRFIQEVEIIPLASEIKVWYEKGNDCFAGTVDLVCLWLRVHKEREGSRECVHDYAPQKEVLWCHLCGREVEQRLVLLDWKSSNTIRGKAEYAQQDTAYATAIEKAARLKFKHLWVVRLDKSRAEYEVCEVTDRKAAWREFIAISRAFDEKTGRGESSLLEPIIKKETIVI